MASVETKWIGFTPNWPGLTRYMQSREAQTGYEYSMLIEPGMVHLTAYDPVIDSYVTIQCKADTAWVRMKKGYERAIPLFREMVEQADRPFKERHHDQA